MKKNTLFSTIQTTAFWAILVRFSSLFKVSFVCGSYFALFSAANMITPLIGAFGGVSSCLSLFGVGLFLRLVLFKSIPLKFLAYYIPGLFASLYWARADMAVRLLVPVLCMILFIMHPSSSVVYASLWIIPVALYFISQKNSLYTALGSTFTAHAVGSLIWIYTVPTTTAFWLALTPVALAERVCFALGMAFVYHVMNFLISYKEAAIQVVLSQLGQLSKVRIYEK